MKNIDISNMSLDDAALVTLRKCGHFLHHSAGKDSDRTSEELLSVLTDDEKRTLIDILEKCLNTWQK